MTRLVLVLAVLGLGAGAAPGQTPDAVARLARQKGWHADLEAGRAAARRSGKPLLVVFRCAP